MITSGLLCSLPLCAAPRAVATSAAGSRPAIGKRFVHERRVPGRYCLPGFTVVADLRVASEVPVVLPSTRLRWPCSPDRPDRRARTSMLVAEDSHG